MNTLKMKVPNQNQFKNMAYLCVLLPLLFTQALSFDLSLSQPNKKIKPLFFGYISKFTFQEEKEQKQSFHDGRYFFSLSGVSNKELCTYLVEFLDEDNIYSSGHRISLKYDCSITSGLKNQTVYQARYSTFTKTRASSPIQLFNVEVSYTKADYEKGNYMNLVLKSVDPKLPGFQLKQTNYWDFPLYGPIFDWFVFFVMILILLVVGSRLTGTTHFSENCCYKFAKLVQVYNSFNIGNILYAAIDISTIFVSRVTFGYLIIPLIFIVMTSFSHAWKNFLTDLVKITRRNFLFFGLILVLNVLSLEFVKFYPYTSILPSLMWLVDKMIGQSALSYYSIVAEEVASIAVIGTCFYIPSSITGTV